MTCHEGVGVKVNGSREYNVSLTFGEVEKNILLNGEYEEFYWVALDLSRYAFG